jgi:hypothetical protein
MIGAQRVLLVGLDEVRGRLAGRKIQVAFAVVDAELGIAELVSDLRQKAIRIALGARSRCAAKVEGRRSHPLAGVVPAQELQRTQGDLAAHVETAAVEVADVGHAVVLLSDE